MMAEQRQGIQLDTISSSLPPPESDWPDWSEQERQVARTAFDAAHGRALASLINEAQLKAALIDSELALWQLHDFLSIQRHGLEGRFDFRPQALLFLFASLVRDNLLDMAELRGLAADKLAKIQAMALF
jgi:hypothetical protein